MSFNIPQWEIYMANPKTSNTFSPIFPSFVYRTRAIITRGLYTFYPILEVQKRLFKVLFT